MKNCCITKFIVVALTLAAAADAWAQIPVFPATPIEGQLGKATLGERESSGALQSTDFPGSNALLTSGVEYLIDVLGNDQIHAFAVSTNSVGSPSTFFLNWNADVIGEANWATYSFDLGGPGGTTVQTADLGDFSDLFGDDLAAVLFYRGANGAAITDVDNDDDMASWNTTSARFFYGDAFAFSEFIALNGSGQLLEASNVLVPEPSSLALAGIATAGLVGLARRRRKEMLSRTSSALCGR